jgi:hypothetical protein
MFWLSIEPCLLRRHLRGTPILSAIVGCSELTLFFLRELALTHMWDGRLERLFLRESLSEGASHMPGLSARS